MQISVRLGLRHVTVGSGRVGSGRVGSGRVGLGRVGWGSVWDGSGRVASSKTWLMSNTDANSSFGCTYRESNKGVTKTNIHLVNHHSRNQKHVACYHWRSLRKCESTPMKCEHLAWKWVARYFGVANRKERFIYARIATNIWKKFLPYL